MTYTLQQLRKEIKQIGFNFKRKDDYITYYHIESGQELTFNVFTVELLERWKPLFDYLTQHTTELNQLRKATGYYGLKSNLK